MTSRSSVALICTLVVLSSPLSALPASAHSVAIDTSVQCPSSTPNAGFIDVSGLDATTQLAINCVAALGISKGTSSSAFSPSNPVTREQMALFLIRQATVQGIAVPAPVGQGFTDIVGLSPDRQDAINQLAQLGIAKGTTSTTFSPTQVVTRWQMALFLYRLSIAANVATEEYPNHNEFTDLTGVLPEAATAINALADTHIALGTSGSSFSPNLDVLRWQMALFLTRTLAAASGVTMVVTAWNSVGSSPGILSPRDQIMIDFSGGVVPVGTGTVLDLLDADGTTATLTCGTNVFCLFVVTPPTINSLLITITSDLTPTGGSVASINPTVQVERISGLTSASLAPINVVGSGPGRIFGGF